MRTFALLLALATTGCAGAGNERIVDGCPRPDWPGPWIACAEARWVKDVVEAAGYQVWSDTGSAWVASGRGATFYVWGTETGARDRRPMDDGVRTSWSSQGFTFWVEAGPSDTDRKPSIAELERVVASSRRLRRRVDVRAGRR